MDKRGGEHQDFPSETFCLTVPKTSLWESFTVAIISGIEKFWMRGGEYQDFPWKSFCLTVSKRFVGQFFTVAIISGIEKVWIRRGASKFSVENFWSHSAKSFRRGILYCCINFGHRKKLDKRGGEYQDFQSKIFCLIVPKISVGETFTVALFLGVKKFG